MKHLKSKYLSTKEFMKSASHKKWGNINSSGTEETGRGSGTMGGGEEAQKPKVQSTYLTQSSKLLYAISSNRLHAI